MNNPDKMTLEDHAIAWHKENGRTMNPGDVKMYKEWVEWAFSDFKG